MIDGAHIDEFENARSAAPFGRGGIFTGNWQRGIEIAVLRDIQAQRLTFFVAPVSELQPQIR